MLVHISAYHKPYVHTREQHSCPSKTMQACSEAVLVNILVWYVPESTALLAPFLYVKHSRYQGTANYRKFAILPSFANAKSYCRLTPILYPIKDILTICKQRRAVARNKMSEHYWTKQKIPAYLALLANPLICRALIFTVWHVGKGMGGQTIVLSLANARFACNAWLVLIQTGRPSTPGLRRTFLKSVLRRVEKDSFPYFFTQIMYRKDHDKTAASLY